MQPLVLLPVILCVLAVTEDHERKQQKATFRDDPEVTEFRWFRKHESSVYYSNHVLGNRSKQETQQMKRRAAETPVRTKAKPDTTIRPNLVPETRRKTFPQASAWMSKFELYQLRTRVRTLFQESYQLYRALHRPSVQLSYYKRKGMEERYQFFEWKYNTLLKGTYDLKEYHAWLMNGKKKADKPKPKR